MEAVGQFRPRGNEVDRGIENQLGPLRRPRVLQSDSLETGRADQLGCFLNDSEGRLCRFERTHPCCGVEFVLHMCVGVARAAHKRCAANDKSFCKVGNNLFAAEAVLRGKDSALFEKVRDGPHGVHGLRGFAGNNAQIEFRQSARLMRGMQLCVKLMRSGYLQPLAIQCLGVLRTPNKGPNLRDLRQVRGVEASDRAAPDDANAFDQSSDSWTRRTWNWTSIRAGFLTAKDADVRREPWKQIPLHRLAEARERWNRRCCANRR